MTEHKRKSVPLGRYREIPIPEDWFAVLEECKPFEQSLRLPQPNDARVAVQAVLADLEDRTRLMIQCRYGFEDGQVWSLESIGTAHQLTRERVRQVIDRAIGKHRLLGRLAQVIKGHGWFASGSQLVIFSQPEDAQTQWCQFGLSNILGLNHVMLRNGYRVVSYKTVSEAALLAQLRCEPHFYSLTEAEALSNLSSYELIHAHGVLDGVFLTASATFGSHKWRMPECIEAIARALLNVGVQEWHFSQMAQALRFVFPERFVSLTGRDIAAVVSRPGSRFQNVGAKGMWRLSSVGDGFADTKAAVIGILEQNAAPLHHAVILERLQRPIREATLLAMLAREDVFEHFGSGFYGLQNAPYPDVTDGELERWVLQELGQLEVLSIEDLQLRASAAGLDFDQIRLVVQRSKRLHFHAKLIAVERIEKHHRRQLQRWLTQPELSKRPSDDVLSFGIQDCLRRGDGKNLEKIIAAFSVTDGA